MAINEIFNTYFKPLNMKETLNPAENSNKLPKNPCSGRKKWVEDVITLGPRAQAILVLMKGRTQNGESKEGGHILINYLFKIQLPKH